MSFTLYTLLKKGSPETNIKQLKKVFDDMYINDKGYSSLLETIPFKKDYCIKLSWPNWFFKVYYKEGKEALLDSEFISNESGKSSIKDVERRIKVVFHGDECGDFVNDCIILQEYLLGIPESLTYDIQKKVFMQM
ncbi:hypothetical protein [Motilimonas sp. E26]|uniref:hypothetical protein n=1 Tax=Motilimonas sp. E26 TaxID=2865674 RepID=UPI001E2897EC|nr:hypothetical protein [Motilimonas sp. E26]MCE0559450.1 hypothetical protein [Motilimonas sp. E26]